MPTRRTLGRRYTCHAGLAVLVAGLIPAIAVTAHAQTNNALSASVLAGGPLTVQQLPMSSGSKSSLSDNSSEPEQTIHILVGHSVLLKTPARLKRIYVSNPIVLDSFTSSPTQIVVTAKTPGVSSLMLWDEFGHSQTYLVLSDIDVSGLQNEIHEALPYDDVRVEAQQDRVSLSGTATSDASADTAYKIAGLYAKSVVNSLVVRPLHPRQVKLKVQIVEVDRTRLEQFGINFLSNGKNSSGVTTGQFPTTATYTPPSASTPASISVSNPLNMFFYNFGLTSGVTIQDLQNKQILQILAEPTITTISGQKASFLSGGEFPFPVIQGSSGGVTSITIQFRSYGVKVEFTPVVNPDGTISLKVAPEVSALDFTNAVTISGYTIPALSTRRADTQVELRDGQSFAISGLLDNRTTDMLSKVPGIGDIPILGQLFRSKNINHSTVELMVIVTPTVVDPLTDITAPTLPKFPTPMLDPTQFDKADPKASGSPVTNPTNKETAGKN